MHLHVRLVLLLRQLSIIQRKGGTPSECSIISCPNNPVQQTFPRNPGKDRLVGALLRRGDRAAGARADVDADADADAIMNIIVTAEEDGINQCSIECTEEKVKGQSDAMQ